MSSATPKQMQCHYEVLGVAMDADVDAIKKAYRKAALQWHPDKNMDRLEEATERFRIISDAYQVLSDPKERSWYDTHRESILRGGDGTFQEGSIDDFVPDLWPYFSPTVLRGGKDFCEVYSKIFQEIVEAEKKDVVRQGKSDSSVVFPLFGTKDSSFAEIKHFYAIWEGFVSRMSFSWMDKYDTREAENRFQRRYVEKMNENERLAAKKEYTQTVRSLVEYCKKRDQRYISGLAKLELEEQEKKLLKQQREKERQEAKALEKLEQRRRFLEEEKIRLEEEKLRKAMEGEEEEQQEQEEVEKEAHFWSCGVCGKQFKSEKQLLNHEGSKKHKDAVKAFLKKGGILTPSPSYPSKNQVDNENEEETFEQFEHLVIETPAPTASNQSSPNEDVKDEDTDSDEDIVFIHHTPSSPNMINEEEEFEYANDEELQEDQAPTISETKGKQKPEKKPGKAKQRKLERELRKAQISASTKNEAPTCQICGEEFSSRTKLFQHVKDLDHAVPLGDSKPADKVSLNENSKAIKKKKH